MLSLPRFPCSAASVYVARISGCAAWLFSTVDMPPLRASKLTHGYTHAHGRHSGAAQAQKRTTSAVMACVLP